MVEWGIPEKIMEHAAQTRRPWFNMTPQLKVIAKLNFVGRPNCNFNVKLEVATKSTGGRTNWHRTIWHPDNLALGQFGTKS